MEFKEGTSGVTHHSFCKKNTRPDTKSTLWGRHQGADMRVFDYEENEKGKTVIKPAKD